MIYLPSHKGEKGLQQLEILYKSTKIEMAHYLTTSTDSHVQLVTTFQKHKEAKSLRSTMKDAKIFANQLNLDVDYGIAKKTTPITSNKGPIQVTKCQPRNIRSILKKEIKTKFEEEVKQQPWGGQKSLLTNGKTKTLIRKVITSIRYGGTSQMLSIVYIVVFYNSC